MPKWNIDGKYQSCNWTCPPGSKSAAAAVPLLCYRVKQQEKMANYCKTIFGDALQTEPLDKYPVSALLLQHTAAVTITELDKVCVQGSVKQIW